MSDQVTVADLADSITVWVRQADRKEYAVSCEDTFIRVTWDTGRRGTDGAPQLEKEDFLHGVPTQYLEAIRDKVAGDLCRH